MPVPVVLDLSHYNEFPGDYAALVAGMKQLKARGIVGIIHKATEGVATADARYALRQKAARETGMLWGGYHFLHGGNIATQMNHFLDVGNFNQADLVAVDHETDATLTELRQFITLVESKIGRQMVIYSGSTIKEQLRENKDAFFGARRLWLAQYGQTAVVQKTWDRYWLWQYSDNGVIEPITGKVDLNAYDGLPSQLSAEWSGVLIPQAQTQPATTIHPSPDVPVVEPQPAVTGWAAFVAFFRSLFQHLGA